MVVDFQPVFFFAFVSPCLTTNNRQAERIVQATRGAVSGSRRADKEEVAHSRSLSPYSARRGQGLTAGSLDAAAPEAGVAGRDRGPTLAIHRAGLGAHLLLPAVSVGAAWLVDLCIRFLENSVEWTAKHHIISGENGRKKWHGVGNPKGWGYRPGWVGRWVGGWQD